MAVWLPRDSATMLTVAPPTEYDLWYDYRFGGGVVVSLAAVMADLLAAANWQRGGRKTGRPKPLRRPKPPKATRVEGRDIDDFRSWYAAQQGGRTLTTREGSESCPLNSAPPI
jgi:hypothetical protein